MAKNILMIGAFDSKGAEYSFLREQILSGGCSVVSMNTGVLGTTDLFKVDIEAERVTEAAGTSIPKLRETKDRGQAMKIMASGSAKIARELYEQGKFDGIIGMGGTGGTSVVTSAMRALPIGVPKVCVSTAASGDTSAYVGTKDITMMPSIVDVAGINRISRIIFCRAAGAICGMVRSDIVETTVDKPIIAVPTSIGYGSSFDGLSALLGMLNSCATGISVVNIDNGFGAGVVASIINHMNIEPVHKQRT